MNVNVIGVREMRLVKGKTKHTEHLKHHHALVYRNIFCLLTDRSRRRVADMTPIAIL